MRQTQAWLRGVRERWLPWVNLGKLEISCSQWNSSKSSSTQTLLRNYLSLFHEPLWFCIAWVLRKGHTVNRLTGIRRAGSRWLCNSLACGRVCRRRWSSCARLRRCRHRRRRRCNLPNRRFRCSSDRRHDGGAGGGARAGVGVGDRRGDGHIRDVWRAEQGCHRSRWGRFRSTNLGSTDSGWLRASNTTVIKTAAKVAVL